MAGDTRTRCWWCLGDERMQRYHDDEWGVPSSDDRRQFEFLVLESAQAGLSWRTILNKRQRYREVYADFDPDRVAAFAAGDVDRLLQDAGIVRNRRKIEASIGNARAFLAIQEEVGSFSDYLWAFVDGAPLVNAWRSPDQLPARTELSDAICTDMKKRGFRFLGSTIMYAHLQATGLVNDHLVDCYRYRGVGGPEPGTAI